MKKNASRLLECYGETGIVMADHLSYLETSILDRIDACPDSMALDKCIFGLEESMAARSP